MAKWSKKTAAVAAGAVVANVLQGLIGNPPVRPSAAQLAATASVAGVLCTLIIGTRIIVSDQELSSANRFPVRGQDEVTGWEGVYPGELISLTFRNGAAVAADIFWNVDAPEVG
jgi:hypothetical protein